MDQEMILLNLNDPVQRALAEELDHQAAEFAGTPQQIYAKIRAESKYVHQNESAEREPDRWGWPFRVRIVGGPLWGYLVKGGPGGQYRLDDVDLFVIEDGVEVKISGCVT